MKKLRIGHIGTKHDHSQGKLDCVRKFPDIFEVVGIVERDPEQLERVKNHPTYRDYPFLTEEQLFNAGCDCVMCEGFEHDLPFDALRCVENGIHVHVDKPAGRDLPAFEKTLSVAKAKGLTVQLAYMYRYNPGVLDCLSLVREGKLGEIHSVTAVMNTDHVNDKRGWLGAFNAGNMFFLGCHMVDLVHLFQGTPERITPYLKTSGLAGRSTIDQVMAVFEYPKGFSIVQANSVEVNGYGRRQLIVCGSEGTYEIKPLENPAVTMYTRSPAPATYSYGAVREERQIDFFSPAVRYDSMMLDFARIVRGEKENPFSYEYEYQTQRLLLASCGEDIDFKKEIKL